jgi:hypothetical protein
MRFVLFAQIDEFGDAELPPASDANGRRHHSSRSIAMTCQFALGNARIFRTMHYSVDSRIAKRIGKQQHTVHQKSQIGTLDYPDPILVQRHIRPSLALPDCGLRPAGNEPESRG